MYIVFFLQCQEVQKQLKNCTEKRAETSITSIVFKGVLCHVCAILMTFLTCILDEY